MSQFNWCHGPHCHTYHTLGRIRGVKGNKVLRTRKISQSSHYNLNDWSTLMITFLSITLSGMVKYIAFCLNVQSNALMS